MVDGRSKGLQFERDQARTISLWVSNNQNKNLLWRSAASGGRATAGHGVQYGDLCAADSDWQGVEFIRNFCVELKRIREINPIKLLTNPKDELMGWWIKNWILSEKFGVNPLLIVKVDFIDPYWIFESDQGMNLARSFNIPYFVAENEKINICGINQKALMSFNWSNIRTRLQEIGYYPVVLQ